MIDRITSFFHRLRHRWSRSEWAVRLFGLEASEDTGEEPGLLLIQIDGLARGQLEAAMAAGQMPFLRRLLERDGYQAHNWYPGLPSTTPAVQAEIYYGIHAGVPAFQFRDRDRNEMNDMFDPAWARKFEADFHSRAEGLLEGGSSWSNIYCGGARLEESHFCGASLGWDDLWRSGKPGRFALFLLAHLPSALRMLGLAIVQVGVGVPLALWGIIRGESPHEELRLVLSRTLVGVALREFLTMGPKVDLARGLPVIQLNFLGYDELSHRRGPASPFAHWCLSGIDGAVRRLWNAAQRSRRRDYSVWIYSDHGQERVRSFVTEVGEGGVGKVIQEALDAEYAGEKPPPFTVSTLGPVGHLYFSTPLGDDRLMALARRLVTAKNFPVPGILRRDAEGAVTWHHAGGETAVPDPAGERVPRHAPEVRAELARDLAALAENRHAGDLVLLGWQTDGDLWTFAPERGAHAGPGLEETRGFLLVPPATKLPPGAEIFIRPEGFRAAARAHLGREDFPHADIAAPSARTRRGLRVLCYNAHSCIGMDGRVSPGRIARMIARHAPDFAAVQELEHGRARSRGEDQAAELAKRLGWQSVFCAAVDHGAERYGHALLSPRPVETVKVGALPGDPEAWHVEPRGAIWARVNCDGATVNVVSAHFGLSAKERLAQMEALLGPDWLGPVLGSEPVILCGDFNCTANSPPYRLATEKKLRDVQASGGGRRALNTFPSVRPAVRIDHVFVSDHFVVERVDVTRDALARVASDHLPLVADLRMESK